MWILLLRFYPVYKRDDAGGGCNVTLTRENRENYITFVLFLESCLYRFVVQFSVCKCKEVGGGLGFILT